MSHVHKWWAKRLGSGLPRHPPGHHAPRDSADAACSRSSTRSIVSPARPSSSRSWVRARRSARPISSASPRSAATSIRSPCGRMAARPSRADGPVRSGVRLRGAIAGHGEAIRELYRSKDSQGRPCDVLYHFWVMQVPCPGCRLPRGPVPVVDHLFCLRRNGKNSLLE